MAPEGPCRVCYVASGFGGGPFAHLRQYAQALRLSSSASEPNRNDAVFHVFIQRSQFILSCE